MYHHVYVHDLANGLSSQHSEKVPRAITKLFSELSILANVAAVIAVLRDLLHT